MESQNIQIESFNNFHMVFLDIKGSSNVINKYEDWYQEWIYTYICAYISESVKINDGHLLYWYGDGGVVLFPIEKGKDTKNNDVILYKGPQLIKALKFCLSSILVSKKLKLKELIYSIEENNQDENISIKIHKLANSDALANQEYIEKEITNICKPPYIFENGKMWKTNKIFDIPRDYTDSLPFRLVIHTGKTILKKIENIPQSLALGNQLSFLSKFEREFSIEDSIVATNQFVNNISSLPIMFSEPIKYDRLNQSNENFSFCIHPSDRQELLECKLRYGLTSSLIEFTSQDKVVPLTNKIKSCLDNISIHNQLQNIDGEIIIKLYNIGLNTFRHNLRNFWSDILKGDNVEVQILMRENYYFYYVSDLNDNKSDITLIPSKQILESVIKTGIQNWGTGERNELSELLKRFKLIIIKDKVEGIDDSNKKQSFSHNFGCSVILNNNKPIEGTTFFLSSPFCKEETVKTDKNHVVINNKVFEYNRLFYFSDVFSIDYLTFLSETFNNYWIKNQNDVTTLHYFCEQENLI